MIAYSFLLSVIFFLYTSVYIHTQIDRGTHTFTHAQTVLSVSSCSFQILLFSRKFRFNFPRLYADSLQDSLTISQQMPLASYHHGCYCESYPLLNVNKHWLSPRLSGGQATRNILARCRVSHNIEWSCCLGLQLSQSSTEPGKWSKSTLAISGLPNFIYKLTIWLLTTRQDRARLESSGWSDMRT